MPVITLLDSHAAWQRVQLESLGVTTVMARTLVVADLVRRLGS